jgi:hypothetical protein
MIGPLTMALALPGTDVTHATADARLELVARRLGRHQDRAGHGVAAVERALGPLEHLDLLYVEELFVEAVRVGAEHTVDNVGEGRLRVAGRDDTADAELRIADVGRVHERDVRHQAHEIAGALDARALDRVLAEGEIAIGTSCRFSERLRAVTTISSIARLSPCA